MRWTVAASDRALLWPVLAILAGACAPTPTPSPVVVAPVPISYTCPQFVQMAAEHRSLPAGSMIAVAMDDYRRERLALFRLHGLKEPPPCKP